MKAVAILSLLVAALSLGVSSWLIINPPHETIYTCPAKVKGWGLWHASAEGPPHV